MGNHDLAIRISEKVHADVQQHSMENKCEAIKTFYEHIASG